MAETWQDIPDSDFHPRNRTDLLIHTGARVPLEPASFISKASISCYMPEMVESDHIAANRLRGNSRANFALVHASPSTGGSIAATTSSPTLLE